MRRIAVLIGVVLVGGAAWVLDAPAPLDPDVEVSTTIAEEAPSASRFSHCAWAYADGDIDTTFAVTSTAEVEYRLSFVGSGELEALEPQLMTAGSALALPLSRFRVQGDSPTIAEFTGGPSAVAVVGQGDTELSAAVCPSALPKVWYLPGGSTLEGQEYTLRLMNPFADDTRVDIRATSELGSEAAPGLEGLTVPARSARTVLVHEQLPGRSSLAFAIEQVEGSVVPMAVIDGDGDKAVWPATRQSETWEFPLLNVDTTTADLVLANDALVEVAYGIDVFGADGTVTSLESGVIPGPGNVRLPVAAMGQGTFGLRVTGDGPMSAAVVATTEGAIAVSPGLPESSTSWLVPGPSAGATARYRLWLMNSGIEPVEITYRFLDATGDVTAQETVVVSATSVASVPATDAGTSAIAVEATGPISVAFSARVDSAVAFAAAVPIGE